MTVPPNIQTLEGVVNSKAIAGNITTMNPISVWCISNWRAIITEFIATSLLILFGCMSCIPLDGFSPHPPLYAPLGFGLIVLINVQIFGHISGAHMNPAVTLVAVIWGNTSLVLGIAYIIVQCIGAIVGFGILYAVSPVDLLLNGICVSQPHSGLNMIQVLFIEIALTLVLAFICCAVWDPVNQNKQDSVPIKFGFAIAGLSIVGGPLSGASMNPARSLGPAVWTGWWAMHWVYWIGPLFGAMFGVVIYKYVLVKKTEPKICV